MRYVHPKLGDGGDAMLEATILVVATRMPRIRRILQATPNTAK